MGAQQNASFNCPANYNTPTSGQYVNDSSRPQRLELHPHVRRQRRIRPHGDLIMRVQ